MGVFDYLKHKLLSDDGAYGVPQPPAELAEQLSASLFENIVKIRKIFSNSVDLQVRELNICNVNIGLVLCEGLVSLSTLSKTLGDPLTKLQLDEPTPEKMLEWIRKNSVISTDQNEIHTYGDLFRFIMSGFVVIMVDGIAVGIAAGIQGYATRSISEPSSEVNVRGSREGFVEPIRINMGMVRRRIKSPTLKFEFLSIGSKSKTDVALAYCTDAVADELITEIKYRLSKVNMDIILESGYLQPFLERGPLSIFSGVGVTERPDSLCAKINEGRVAILVDGTPFALIVPYLFNENFQSVDDYSHRPYFATFIRILKYLGFLFSILLPGLYVAMATYHPELFPNYLMFNIATSEEMVPFPLMLEALLIFFIYEIMREAGLRLPRPIGHAVSIVGALVIGDAAVTAGLIGAPMVMVVALTAISSFVVPSIYEPITILRFFFIVAGGSLGFFGIVMGLCVVFANLCALSPLGIPATAPSAPTVLYSLRDTLFRWSWRQMGRKDLKIQNLPGSNIHSDKGGN